MATKKSKAKKRTVESSIPGCSLTLCEGPDGILVVRGTKCPPGYVAKMKEKVRKHGLRFIEEVVADDE